MEVFVTEWQGDHENYLSDVYDSLEAAIEGIKSECGPTYAGRQIMWRDVREKREDEWYLNSDVEGVDRFSAPSYNIYKKQVLSRKGN